MTRSELLRQIKGLTRASYLARPIRLIHGDGYPTVEQGSIDTFYSWLVNDWIPSQPDSEKLMHLFISLGFSATLFAAAVTGQHEKLFELMKSITDEDETHD